MHMQRMELQYLSKEVSSQVSILWGLVVLLVVLWLLGFAVNVGGDLIHLLVVIAVIIFLYNLLVGRRRV